MNIVLEKQDYSINNVYFSEPIKNSIIENSKFIRLIYSTDIVTMNGIYIRIKLNNITRGNDPSTYKVFFNIENNESVITYIKEVENDILDKVNIKNKKKINKIAEQIIGNIKYIDSVKHINDSLILKISGIWETETEYGLTFKII